MPSGDLVRVAYVLKMYPRFSETFIVTEILAHEAAGLSIDIFSLRPPADGCFHEALARVRAPVTYLAHSRLTAAELWKNMCQASQAFPNVWSSLAQAGTQNAVQVHQAIILAGALRDRGITHIHAHFGTAAASVARLAGRITGIPYSFTAHAKDIFHEEIDHGTLRLKLRDAAAVVTVSDFNVAHLRRCFGDDACVVRRIYNGLDLDEFSYEEPSRRPPVVLAVGRLIEKKGFADLIDACAILAGQGRDFHCQIFGKGTLHDELAAQIQRLGLADRVALLGPRPRGEIIAAIRRSAVVAAPCVLGSDGNRDGLPTVLLEAMALGTPCVSTNVTGIPELVQHEQTGLIATQHDSSSLADQIERLFDNRALGVTLAERARQLIQTEFDIHQNTRQMREVFLHPSPEPAPRAMEAV
ncbi:MAG: glycosyltransferase family 4 protein [Phycisphaerales bacterium]